MEIKDHNISSLENILYRKDEEIQRLKDSHRLFTGNTGNLDHKNYGYENNINSLYDSNQKDFQTNKENSLNSSNNFPKGDFNRDEENENELKNLVRGNYRNDSRRESFSGNLNWNNTKDNTNTDSMIYGNIENKNLNYNKINSTNTSMKIPGRIVSLKKKI